MMTTQMQVQNTVIRIEDKEQNRIQSRVNQQMSALTKAIEKILSLRQMTSTVQKK